MKKIISTLLLFCISTFLLQAQNDVRSVIKSFPYQQKSSSDEALTAMNGWSKSNWKKFFAALDDASQTLNATYALS